MKTVLRSLVLLILLIAAAVASAGYYQVAYTFDGGGKIRSGDQLVPNSYALVGNEVEQDSGGAGSYCAGKITATFTWVPEGSNDPHPSEALVVQECFAGSGWGYDGDTDYPIQGTAEVCDNGLDDSMYGFAYSSDARNWCGCPDDDEDANTRDDLYEHLVTVNDTTGSFSLTCNPYADSGEAADPDEGFSSITYYAYAEAATGTAEVTASVNSITNPGSKVAGLTYDAGKHRQQAAFTVDVQVVNSSTNQPFPASATITYSWSSGASGGPLEFADPNAKTTTATATGPSRCYAVCTVSVSYKGTTYAGTSSAECAAIGGPIDVQIVKPSQLDTASYRHDRNDPTKSWYLTYYDYSHQDANGNPAPLPKHAEQTQNATLTIDQTQPTSSDSRGYGTKVTFDAIPMTFAVPGQVAYAMVGGDDGPVGFVPSGDLLAMLVEDDDPGATTAVSFNGTETVFAEGAFQDAVPKAHFVFNDGVVSNDGTIAGQPVVDITDDSADSMDKVVDPQTHAVSYVKHVYKLSGHRPLSFKDWAPPSPPPLIEVTSAQDPGVGPRTLDPSQHQGRTFWTDIQAYRYILQDGAPIKNPDGTTTPVPMPGVWVQERFTDGDPLDLEVNQSAGVYWPTLLVSALDTGTIASADGAFGSSRKGGAYGNGLVYDGLWYPWPATVTANATARTTLHAYFAGTNGADYDDRSGVDLGLYTITFTPGPPNQPGTAGQTGPTATPPPPHQP